MRDALEITFFGHAALGLVGRDARGQERRILLDPFQTPSFGGLFCYDPIAFEPDTILVSHHHPDHDHVRPFAPGHLVLPADWAQLEARRRHSAALDSLELAGLLVDHDAFDGKIRGGQSWMMALTLGGRRILHSGDIGELPTQERLRALETPPVDIFFVTCGGYYTLGASEAAELARRIGATLTLPFHARTSRCALPGLEGVEPFERRFESSARGGPHVTLEPGELRDQFPSVLILSAPNKAPIASGAPG